MDEIFTIQLNNERLEVHLLSRSNDELIFKILKDGKLEFALTPVVDINDNEAWALVDTYKRGLINKEIIDSIGDKINSHYA